jgi:hypothetical protein
VSETFASFVTQVAKNPDVSLGFADAYCAFELSERERVVDELMALGVREPALVFAPLFAAEKDPVLRARLFQAMGAGLRRAPEAYGLGDHTVLLAENIHGDSVAGIRVSLAQGIACESFALTPRTALLAEFAPLDLAEAVDRVATALVRWVHTDGNAVPEELTYYAYLFTQSSAGEAA